MQHVGLGVILGPVKPQWPTIRLERMPIVESCCQRASSPTVSSESRS